MLKRWSEPNGYKEALQIGLPMIISLGSVAIMNFTDYLFLAKYSIDAVAAVTPASFTAFLFISFFVGTGFYVNVFVSQYHGSGDHNRIGASLWQGIYFALAASAILIGISFIGEAIFTISKHPPEIISKETIYFQIRTAGGGFRVFAVVLSCFFSGIGKTRTIMIVNLISCSLNIPLTYLMIFGFWFFPELGIAGAAIATITASMFGVIMFVFLIFNQNNNRVYSVFSARRFDKNLFKRLIRFGTPSGGHSFIDILAVTSFFLIVGRLGKEQLAAANIVMAIDGLLFIPIFGFSIAATTMVGNAIGKGRPDEAEKAVGSTIQITAFYAIASGISIIIFSEQIASIFRPTGMSAAEFNQILSYVLTLLIVIAIFNLADSFQMILSAALKGAGDSVFPMVSMITLAIFVLIIPVYIIIEYLGLGLYWAFGAFTLYVSVYAGVLFIRYRKGKWKNMKVIEKTAIEKAEVEA